jgi:hypothetical protein
VNNVQGKMKQPTLPRTPDRDLADVIVAGIEEMIGEEKLGLTRSMWM